MRKETKAMWKCGTPFKALSLVLGLVLCIICGCATGARNVSASNLYVVIAAVSSNLGETPHKIAITTPLDIPFAVETQDEAGNHFKLCGTVRQKADQSYCLEHLRVEFPQGGSYGPGALPVKKLGQGIAFGGLPAGRTFSVVITNK